MVEGQSVSLHSEGNIGIQHIALPCLNANKKAHLLPMMPNSLKGLEIGTLVLRLATRAIERHGLARERFHTHEITGFAIQNGRSGRIIGAYCHAEAGDLDLALIDGGEGTGSAEK